MVAAAHPLIVHAGLEVLGQGGNAVDAAIASALVAAVVMPEMCGLGGDLFAIVHQPGQAPAAFLGSGAAPLAATLEQMRRHGDQTPNGLRMPLRGPLSVGVPGLPDAIDALMSRYATRPLDRLAKHALGYARDGFALTPFGAAAIAMCEPFLKKDPAAAAVYLPDGGPPAAGTVLRQPDLADTLNRLAVAGPRCFYEGALARRLAEGLGGAMTPDDLAPHTTPVEAPIRIRYRDVDVWQTGLPTNGLIQLEAMNIVQQGGRLDPGGPEGVHRQAEALKLAIADRLAQARDPAFGPTPVATLLSDDWAARRFAAIGPDSAADEVAGELADGDTTYLCTADGEGMMVSLILSVSSAFGSGVMAPGTGVLFNNRVGRGFSLEDGHPNLFAPGKKTMHTLNCYLVTAPDGTGLIAGGSPGGDGQPQWNLQVLSHLIDGGLDVQAAIEAPRWTVWPGTDPHDLPNPYELRVETRLGEAAIEGLRARGHRVVTTGGWGGSGAAQAIARDPATGVLAGGSDPRVEGLALGF
ncbi:gamma-glutamyltranspeptidase/glutathione hydrolase [Caulobacter ginsengisoli]|uniref:Gamma-glutamyltranspeptidase/glutathione hydrolase n=1 Tax=Caulobacter ginsengisoli TaxID=400775 RepID=A0ABU0IWJ4_9CAUL|nr:gamma-glutamyltransferase family protein [Caulobacter ginsengisoli]MDQ0466370.1 gamma-glutamyltranspeptidase/glutathione hydrolase [Caulobacter ginsengisoli]